MKYLESHEDLIDYALTLFDPNVEVESVNLSDEFNFHVKLKGDQWDGFVNYKIARFVLDFQNDINKLYSKTFDEKVTFKNLDKIDRDIVVRVKVDEGCTELWAALGRVLENAMNNISSKKKFS